MTCASSIPRCNKMPFKIQITFFTRNLIKKTLGALNNSRTHETGLQIRIRMDPDILIGSRVVLEKARIRGRFFLRVTLGSGFYSDQIRFWVSRGSGSDLSN